MVNVNNFIGYFEIENTDVFLERKNIDIKSLPLPFSYLINDFLTKKEIMFFLNQIEKNINVPVGVTGYLHEYTEGDRVGSYRGSIYNKEISKIFFERLKGVYPEKRDFKESCNSDHYEHSHWEFIGVNPLFRFIKYKEGGKLIPHYDAPYIENQEERTLVTMVIYLTNNKSGKTRFINDPQKDIPASLRNLEDWDKEAKEKDIIFTVRPEEGKVVLFDHRIVHDSEDLINDSEKIIIRTDLVFRKK